MHFDDLLALARIYSATTRLSLSTIGNHALNNGRFFQRLLQGEGCTVRNYNRVLQWFSDHWPEGLAWPQDIPRPEPSADSGSQPKEAA